MNYKLHYNTLIYRAQNRELLGYKERHHIIPKCMNGNDNIDNLVYLTAREHYVAHQLLLKIYPNVQSLVFAAHMMGSTRKGNRNYGWLRERFSFAISKANKGKEAPNKGINHTDTTKKKISESGKGRISGMKGKIHSVITKNKMSISHAGYIPTQEHRNNLSIAKKGIPGTKKSKITRKKMSISGKGRKWFHTSEGKSTKLFENDPLLLSNIWLPGRGKVKN